MPDAFYFDENGVKRISKSIKYIETSIRSRPLPQGKRPFVSVPGSTIVKLTSTLTARAAGLLGHSDMGIVQALDVDGNIANADPEKLVKVWNLSTHIVGSGKYVICTSVNGKFVANWADC